MDKLFPIAWDELLIPTHSVAQMVLRGSVMYLRLFLTLRFVMPRQLSAIADIFVIADVAQNAFAMRPGSSSGRRTAATFRLRLRQAMSGDERSQRVHWL